MAQNTSSAVMQQRAEPHDSLDYFPTPLWATRALCEYVLGGTHALGIYDVWEPACGGGHMARALSDYFPVVVASDVHSYGYGEVLDFLMPRAALLSGQASADWIITNPPFRLAEQFIKTAQDRSRKGCAMLVRTSFLEGVGRYKNLFSDHPPDSHRPIYRACPYVQGARGPQGKYGDILLLAGVEGK